MYNKGGGVYVDIYLGNCKLPMATPHQQVSYIIIHPRWQHQRFISLSIDSSKKILFFYNIHDKFSTNYTEITNSECENLFLLFICTCTNN